MVGHRQIGTVLSVGRRNKYVKIFRKAQAPGIVAGRSKELQILAIRIKFIDALAEGVFRSADFTVEARITQYAPYLVVQSIFKGGRSGMDVALRPTGHHDFLDVGLVIAVGVF